MRRFSPSSIPAFLLLLLFAIHASAEQSVRECIDFASTHQPGKQYLLPSTAQWEPIGSLTFDIDSASDIIASGSVFFGEGNPANAQVAYRLMLDGQRKGLVYFHRTAKGFFDSFDLRSVITNVASGVHTLQLEAFNNTGQDLRIRAFWLSPHMVDSSETTVTHNNNTGPSIPLTTAWTTVATVSITPSSDRMVYVGGFVEIGSGTPDKRVDYRLYRSSSTPQELRLPYEDTVPGFPDGAHVARFDESPHAGTNTYALQARATNGDPMEVDRAFLFAQTMPKYTIFSAGTWVGTLPSNDGQFHEIVTSPFEFINAASQGTSKGNGNFTWGTGFGATSIGGSMFGDLQWCFRLMEKNGTTVTDLFDVGCHTVHSDGLVINYKNLMSDWGGKVGLQRDRQYAVRLQAKNWCSGTASADATTFQIAVIPATNLPTLSDGSSCADAAGRSWASCCQEDPSCTFVCQSHLSFTTAPSFDPCN